LDSYGLGQSSVEDYSEYRNKLSVSMKYKEMSEY